MFHSVANIKEFEIVKDNSIEMACLNNYSFPSIKGGFFLMSL